MLLNPHFATGTKDQEGSRIFYEPLAGWDADGNLVPVLAAEIPSRENGGLSADGKTVTWKLKSGVTWHDGKPFTADDVVFTWRVRRATRPPPRSPVAPTRTSRSRRSTRTPCASSSPSPRRSGPSAFVGTPGMIIPQAPVRATSSAPSRARRRPTSSRWAPGPTSSSTSSRATCVRGEINTNYHIAEPAALRHARDEGRRRRHLGRARGAADRRIRLRLEPAGRGRDPQAPGGRRQGQGRRSCAGGNIEFILLNYTDPWNEVDGERGSAKSQPPGLPATRRCARRWRC